MLNGSEPTHHATLEWAHRTMSAVYSAEIMALAHKDSGLHFSAANMTEEKLRSFDITVLSKQMEDQTPTVWTLLDSLFSADPKLQYKREWARNKARKEGNTSQQRSRTTAHDGDIEMDDVTIPVPALHLNHVEEDELNSYYQHDFCASEPLEQDPEGEDEAEDALEHGEDRYKQHIVIVSK